MTNAGGIANFHAANNSVSFKFKQKITGVTGNNGSKNVAIKKYLSNFWKNLEVSLINCEINLILTWYDKSVLYNDTKKQHFQ